MNKNKNKVASLGSPETAQLHISGYVKDFPYRTFWIEGSTIYSDSPISYVNRSNRKALPDFDSDTAQDGVE